MLANVMKPYITNITYYIMIYTQATVSIKMGSLLVCFYSFDLSCPILEKR